MLELIRSLSTRRRGEHGASAVEYALLVTGIAAAIVVAVAFLGRATATQYRNSCNNVGANPSRTASSAATTC